MGGGAPGLHRVALRALLRVELTASATARRSSRLPHRRDSQAMYRPGNARMQTSCRIWLWCGHARPTKPARRGCFKSSPMASRAGLQEHRCPSHTESKTTHLIHAMRPTHTVVLPTPWWCPATSKARIPTRAPLGGNSPRTDRGGRQDAAPGQRAAPSKPSVPIAGYFPMCKR